eukprot:CAMPEP_0115204272 /NCGR_PEP_ID=MMETSP0270-20121206/19079_1 /TAXON_ID=71861 /ORGANISM="Scrippsiella trochoidea, Strain CCMP3099" /LENGTH=116 /DNA_ID=CAMNT_0002617757 /DNA_START=226 /DNA_END=573 /DNA_ORIENTATION=+
MARGGSSLVPCLLALAAVLFVGHYAAAFLSATVRAPATAGASTDEHRGLGSQPLVASAQDLVGAGRSLRTAAAAPASGAFSGATFLPALLMTARTMVSVCAVVARRAKAPISEYGA